jgi:L-lactate dehydrogenase complex protein LldG
MSSRDEILGRIRSQVVSGAAPQLPPVNEVWPRLRPSAQEMADRFTAELTAVFGEVVRCPTMDAARAKLLELVPPGDGRQIGAMDRPLCRELANGLAPGLMAFPQPEWNPKGMSQLSAGLLEADILLADTGSAMVACGTPLERILCYLPPLGLIVATVDRLAEHLPAAWESIATRAADPNLRGEFVFITGPSRTADIEKILILGAHGPKRLVVLLVG